MFVREKAVALTVTTAPSRRTSRCPALKIARCTDRWLHISLQLL